MRFMGELPEQMDANRRMLTGLQDRLRSNEARALEERKAYLEAQLGLMKKSVTTTVTDNGRTLSVYSQDPSLSLDRLSTPRTRCSSRLWTRSGKRSSPASY